MNKEMEQALDAASGNIWAAPPTPVESGSETPLYQQIYLIIRNRILNGEYPDRSLLPSEHATAELFGVSRITAKRALNEVAAEGLCVRRRGRGSMVTYKPAVAPLKADVQGLLDFLFHMNLETEGFVLEFDYVPASNQVARMMEIDPGTEVQRSVRARRLDGTPFSYLTTFVPADLGRAYERDHLSNQAVLTLLEKTGVEVADAEQTITATLAEAVAAEALGVKPGSPLLRISRTVYDRAGRVVEFIVGLYRPDQYQYRSLLSRDRSSDTPAWTAAG
ncbi:MAG: GntR family transcriptional regulator [Magnetovibrio sp.]|nr:GntR family transcriptional regulator [Magnetovibrio sp.]